MTIEAGRDHLTYGSLMDEQERLKAQAAGQAAWGVIGDADHHQRYMKLLPGRWRNRRKCHCGCGAKQSHGGYANGLAMTGGCEWSMRRWVKHGYERPRASVEGERLKQ